MQEVGHNAGVIQLQLGGEGNWIREMVK